MKESKKRRIGNPASRLVPAVCTHFHPVSLIGRRRWNTDSHLRWLYTDETDLHRLGSIEILIGNGSHVGKVDIRGFWSS
jgi:hypothetical protein